MADCTAGADALRDLLDAEYAFGARARSSVRSAFLEYLAADSLVLQPVPTPGRAFYESARENADRLEWYPAIADVAGSGDLGFTTGPWIYTSAAGGEAHGDFLTLWKRDPACRWQVVCDGGISHAVAAPGSAEPKLSAAQAPYAQRDPPPQKLIAEDAVGRAFSDFQDTVQEDGVAPALRTYARTADFRLLTDGEAPMELARANRYFHERGPAAEWREAARGRSADSSVAYSVGVLGAADRPGGHACVQVWQYAPRVANWGLRLLLLHSLTPPLSK